MYICSITPNPVLIYVTDKTNNDEHGPPLVFHATRYISIPPFIGSLDTQDYSNYFLVTPGNGAQW